jgi:hypothetical protein
MKYRVWVVVTGAVWIAIWALDLANTHRLKAEVDFVDVTHIGILITGLLAEMLGWRVAGFINVGYFLAVGLWTIVQALSLQMKSLTTASDAATAIGLFALPMITQGIINFAMYRSRGWQKR